MNSRTVKNLLFAHQVNMEGMLVRQPFPTQQIDQIDPFLLLHHAKVKFREGSNPLRVGVGPHPHRGFSPVTFVYAGGVHHRDSRGNNSVVYTGGTQWMHAGRGIMHSERPDKELAKNGGVMEIIQLWVNVPQINKMDQPAYFPLHAEDTPTWIAEDNGTKVMVVAGRFKDVIGKIKTYTPINTWRVSMKAGAQLEFHLPSDHQAFFYLLHGELKLKGYGMVEEKNVIYFNQDGEGFDISATTESEILVMSGLPINEPVKQYGPYVMNSQTEIMEAIRDYQMGKMGILIEDEMV